jgi:hypothetical protein
MTPLEKGNGIEWAVAGKRRLGSETGRPRAI